MANHGSKAFFQCEQNHNTERRKAEREMLESEALELIARLPPEKAREALQIALEKQE